MQKCCVFSKVGRSSVEVVVWLEQKMQGKWRKLMRALFLMACRNATNTSATVVNPLIPANDEEKRIHMGGESGYILHIYFVLEIQNLFLYRRSKTEENSTSKRIYF